MKIDFIPKRDGDLNSLEKNFVKKIALHGPVLELSDDEIAESIAIIEKHMQVYDELIYKKAATRSATEINRAERKSALIEMRRMARKIKGCKKYNAGIGDDLAIIGPDIQEKVLAEMKPVLSAVYNGNELVMKFRKRGTSGVNIYSRRGTETEYTYLGFHASSPYNDARAKLESSRPEAREYYAKFVDGDKEIGQMSDIFKVIVP